MGRTQSISKPSPTPSTSFHFHQIRRYCAAKKCTHPSRVKIQISVISAGKSPNSEGPNRTTLENWN